MVLLLCLAYTQSVSAQSGPYDTSPTDPTACWADPAPYDGPNYRVDCNDPACDIGPCAVKECWYDPARDEPARLAPSFTVSCSDPRCNVGPCAGSGSGVSGSTGTNVSNADEPPLTSTHAPGTSSAGTPGSAGSVGTLPAEPEEVPAQTPEWTNLNDSDPGVASDVQETDTEKVTQRNESDMEFLRGRAAERVEDPPTFVRILNFLTSWFW